jgi:hypothetical protein
MTTVASGRCTSAPVSVASAIGTKTREATSAVMRTCQRTFANRLHGVAPPAIKLRIWVRDRATGLTGAANARHLQRQGVLVE